MVLLTSKRIICFWWFVINWHMWQHPVAWAYNFKCLLVGGQIWSFTQLALILDFESGKKTLIFNLTIIKILSITVSEVSEKIKIVSNLIWYYISMFYFVLLLVKKTLDDPHENIHDMHGHSCLPTLQALLLYEIFLLSMWWILLKWCNKTLCTVSHIPHSNSYFYVYR